MEQLFQKNGKVLAKTLNYPSENNEQSFKLKKLRVHEENEMELEQVFKYPEINENL